jgi:hypothetical protein
MPKKIEALAQGFCEGKRRRKGEVFVIADNVKVGKWMKVLKDVPSEASQQADNGEKDALIEKAKALGIAATKNWGVDKLNAAISEAEAALAEASQQA